MSHPSTYPDVDAARTKRTRDTEANGPLRLSARELEILRVVADGHSTVDIARMLFLSPKTIQFHLNNVFRKLGVNSRLAAVLVAMDLGIPGLGSGPVRRVS